MNTVPTSEGAGAPLVDLVFSLLPWAVAGAVATGVVWALVWAYRSGRLAPVAAWARGLMVKRSVPSPRDDAPEAAVEPPAASGSPSWLPRALGAAAALPALVALPWAAWAVAHVLPVPLYISLPLGVLFDLVMVASVVLALLVPSTARQASALGWAAAVLASAAIVVHVGWSGALLFAATPLLSKALWGLLVTIRRTETAARAEEERQREEVEEARRREEEEKAAAEAEAARLASEERARRDTELSAELTFEQRKIIADRKREAAYEKALAEADRELDAAKADTEHQRKLADIRRLGAEQRAMDEEAGKVEIAREELIRRVKASRPVSFALTSGEVPDDLSSLPRSPGTPQVMGFGAVMGSDLVVSRGRPVGDQPVIDPQVRELLAYIAEAGEGASVRGAARHLEVSAPTIRRWRDKAEAAGLDVSALKRTSK